MDTEIPRDGLRLREQDLAGKVALITGASRGIGRAIALNLASRGCSILGTCSGTSSLHLIDTLSHTITDMYKDGPHSASTPKVIALAANILDTNTPSNIATKLQSHFNSHIDIFINNATVANAAAVGELSDEHIHEYLTGNIELPVKIVEELVKQKLFRPNSRIICISSVRARKAWASQSMYMATKSAQESLCRAWSDAFGGKYPEQYGFMAGTTANAVMVGLTRTEAVYSYSEEIIKKVEEEFVPGQSIPRVGEVGDVAEVVGLLCREESRWITGSVVSADGGGVHVL